MLHLLLVTIAPGCLVAGWWQVNRALSGNILSYFYSVEWPVFSVLAVLAWWQLVHDEPVPGEYVKPQKEKRSFWHRDDEVPTRPLAWDPALETPELVAYNQYLRQLSTGNARKNWRNPRGLPFDDAGEDVAGAGARPGESTLPTPAHPGAAAAT